MCRTLYSIRESYFVTAELRCTVLTASLEKRQSVRACAGHDVPWQWGRRLHRRTTPPPSLTAVRTPRGVAVNNPSRVGIGLPSERLWRQLGNLFHELKQGTSLAQCWRRKTAEEGACQQHQRSPAKGHGRLAALRAGTLLVLRCSILAPSSALRGDAELNIDEPGYPFYPDEALGHSSTRRTKGGRGHGVAEKESGQLPSLVSTMHAQTCRTLRQARPLGTRWVLQRERHTHKE